MHTYQNISGPKRRNLVYAKEPFLFKKKHVIRMKATGKQRKQEDKRS